MIRKGNTRAYIGTGGKTKLILIDLVFDIFSKNIIACA